MRETLGMYNDFLESIKNVSVSEEPRSLKERFDLCVTIGYIYQKYGNGDYITDYSRLGRLNY